MDTQTINENRGVIEWRRKREVWHGKIGREVEGNVHFRDNGF